MALYRLAVKVHSRSSGGNMVAASAYRAAERLHEPASGPVASAIHASAHIAGERLAEEHGRVWDYTRKAGVLHSELVLPAGAPERFRDRQTLWGEAERSERRRDAQVGREFVLTLPRELGPAGNVELVRDFARDSLASRGMVVDFAVHQVRASDGLPHPHGHVLCAMRRSDESGFTVKDRGWNRRELFNELRHEWEAAQNRALERASVPDRVSCERLEVQLERALETGDFGQAATLDRDPLPYLPRDAWFAEKVRPGATELGGERAAIVAENANRAETYAAVRAMADEAPEAPARFIELRRETGDPVAAFTRWADWAEDALDRLREFAASVAEGTREVVGAAWDLVRPMTDAELDAMLADVEREDAAEIDRDEQDQGIEIEA